MKHDILDLLNKPATLENCMFPLANLYFELSADYVPK